MRELPSCNEDFYLLLVPDTVCSRYEFATSYLGNRNSTPLFSLIHLNSTLSTIPTTGCQEIQSQSVWDFCSKVKYCSKAWEFCLARGTGERVNTSLLEKNNDSCWDAESRLSRSSLPPCHSQGMWICALPGNLKAGEDTPPLQASLISCCHNPSGRRSWPWASNILYIIFIPIWA